MPGRLPAPRLSNPRAVVVTLVGLALLVALVLFLVQTVLPRLSQRDPLPSLDESRRRVAGVQLARYAARAEHGDFLPPAALTIAVHERFLARSLAASLPFEQAFDEGRIEARLDSARVEVADGATILTLRGRARLAKNLQVYADLVVQGTLGIDDVDFERGRIVPRIEFTDARVLDSGPSGIGAFSNPVAAYFTHRSAAEWNRFQPVLPLPLQFSTRVTIPAVEGDVQLPAADLPVHLRFQALTALERRLVVSIEVRPDTAAGTFVGPPTGPWDAPPGAARVGTRDRLLGLVRWRGTRAADRPPPPSASQIAVLRGQVLRLARADSLWSALRGAEHDLTILAPEPLLLSIVQAMTQRYRTGVEVTLDPDVEEEVEEEIKTKVLGKMVTAGRVRASIRVDQVRGRLIATGDPTVELEPPDGLTVGLPLRLAGGQGTARFDVEWDPKALAWVVCKGFRTQRTLDGTLGQVEHDVHGRLRFAVEEGRVVGRPALRRDRVRLPLDLTARSWARARAVFEEQDKTFRCGMAMDPDRVLEKLRALGRRGVRVRLPGSLPGFELPLSIGRSVIDSTWVVGADVSAFELRMTPSALVVGLDGLVALRTLPGPAPPEAATEPPENGPAAAATRASTPRLP